MAFNPTETMISLLEKEIGPIETSYRQKLAKILDSSKRRERSHVSNILFQCYQQKSADPITQYLEAVSDD